MNRKNVMRLEFSRRLERLMLKKGWRQSELARQADMPRDSVSTYVRGRTLPTPKNLQKLAAALGVAPQELLPNHIEATMDDEVLPSLEMKVSKSSPDKAWLRVNRLVNFSTAVKVAELLQNDDVSAD